MRHILLVFFILIIGSSTRAQQLNIYDWASLQFYRSGTDVTETPNNIVFNAGSGLVFINKSNIDDIRHVTTIDGLSGSNIINVRYIPDAKKLFIYYSDGSFDLMDESLGITSVQDIKNNNVLVPNKALNAAVVDGKYIYLCFSFGMVEYDATEEVFTNTLSAEESAGSLSMVTGFTSLITSDCIPSIAQSSPIYLL